MRALLLAGVCLLAAPALADRTITVDGNAADWAGVTTCPAEPAGDANGGVDLIRSCVENNNAAGNTGSLSFLFQAAGNLPTNIDTYFGFYVDSNNDGQITSTDEVWAIYFPANSGNTPASINVYTPLTYNLVRAYTSTTTCRSRNGVTGSGWSGRRSGTTVELSISYNCLDLAFGNDTRLMQTGLYPNFDLTQYFIYDGTASTLTDASPPPDVQQFTARGGDASNRLYWTNPARHRGVLILRNTTAIPSSAVPTRGVQYSTGQTLGGARVIYADQNGSAVSTFNDTGLTNGTRYHYRIFNHDQTFNYSAGNAPTSAFLFSDATVRSGNQAMWCYSVGFPALAQPLRGPTQRIFSAHNGGAVLGLQQAQDLNGDGLELWRPGATSAAVQGRALYVPVAGGSSSILVVGDQSGRVSAFNPTTGATLWTTASLGTAIEAQPIAQLAQFSNAAYTAARGAVDLIFVGTRQTPAANRVFALNAATGAVVWTYAPGTLDLISGGGTVDYTRNEVWIPSRTGLAVLDTRTGAQVALVTGAGAFDRGLSFNSTTKQVYAVNNAGTALGFDNVTHAQVWSVNVGLAPSSYLYPVSSTVNGAQGFIFSSAAGNVVRRYNFTSPTVAVQAWSTAVPGATGAYVATLNGVDKLHVGTNDGRLLRLHTETGAIERALTFVTGTGQRVVGMPSVDPSVPGGGRVTAGTSDGRVCGFSL